MLRLTVRRVGTFPPALFTAPPPPFVVLCVPCVKCSVLPPPHRLPRTDSFVFFILQHKGHKATQRRNASLCSLFAPFVAKIAPVPFDRGAVFLFWVSCAIPLVSIFSRARVSFLFFCAKSPPSPFERRTVGPFDRRTVGAWDGWGGSPLFMARSALPLPFSLFVSFVAKISALPRVLYLPLVTARLRTAATGRTRSALPSPRATPLRSRPLRPPSGESSSTLRPAPASTATRTPPPPPSRP